MAGRRKDDKMLDALQRLEETIGELCRTVQKMHKTVRKALKKRKKGK